MADDPNHRLSSIELLPERATADINWAIKTLDEGRRTDSDVLFEFNDRLAVIACGPISQSAFGRYALRKRKIFGAKAEFQMMSAAFKKENAANNVDEQTELLTNMLMTAIYMYSARKGMDPKEILDMSRALAALNSAKRISSSEKTKADSATKSKIDAVCDAAEKAISTTSSEEVYNIFDETPPLAPDASPVVEVP
jgi:hypothetical protein